MNARHAKHPYRPSRRAAHADDPPNILVQDERALLGSKRDPEPSAPVDAVNRQMAATAVEGCKEEQHAEEAGLIAVIARLDEAWERFRAWQLWEQFNVPVTVLLVLLGLIVLALLGGRR
ncbi:MAG TPA: hypothetical protein VGK45_18830 [Thermoanaerobaculia bacterium]|jgi:hypothetical protein